MPTQTNLALWDIYEEHLDEAAFLWGQWERALAGPHHTLRELVDGPEERLRAHLDALGLGGPAVAERLLLPALAGEEPSLVFAAAWSLLHAEQGDHLPAVLARLCDQTSTTRVAVARALELAERGDVAERLELAWDDCDPLGQSCIIDVVAARKPAWVSQRLDACLRSGDPALRRAAFRAARHVPHHELGYDVELALAGAEGTDPSVQYEALATGYTLGLPCVVPACVRLAAAAGVVARLATALMASAAAGMTTELDVLLGKPDTRRNAIWALGFAGDAAAGDRLAALTSDEELGPLAAEALSMITGVSIVGPLSRPAPPAAADVDDGADDEPPPEVRPEDDLALPNAEALAALWQRMRGIAHQVGSLVHGQPRSVESLRVALSQGTMWRRPVLALELAARTRTGVTVDWRTWGRRQGG